MNRIKSSSIVPEKLGTIVEEESTLRHRIREIVDGRMVTIAMGSVTVWALFGDDIRLVATSKEADEAFYITFLISFLLFLIELIANSLVLPGYKFSFFFWLDVIATVSLFPDVPMLLNPVLEIFG
jgi:hypothetical protein